jgi:hypothetical protein
VAPARLRDNPHQWILVLSGLPTYVKSLPLLS